MNKLLAPLLDGFSGGMRGRKRKRSVSPVWEQGKHQTTELRLLTRQIKVITIAEPAEGWESQPKVSPVEDTKAQAQERRRRAALAAVDFEHVIKQSAVQYPAFKPTKVTTCKLKEEATPKSIAVVECSKQRPSLIMHPHVEFDQLISRDPTPKRLLVVGARLAPTSTAKLRSKVPQHTFYYSEPTIGGKSAGYAWGYRGSFPRATGQMGYLRDTMKKGLDEGRVQPLSLGGSRAVRPKAGLNKGG